MVFSMIVVFNILARIPPLFSFRVQFTPANQTVRLIIKKEFPSANKIKGLRQK